MPNRKCGKQNDQPNGWITFTAITHILVQISDSDIPSRVKKSISNACVRAIIITFLRLFAVVGSNYTFANFFYCPFILNGNEWRSHTQWRPSERAGASARVRNKVIEEREKESERELDEHPFRSIGLLTTKIKWARCSLFTRVGWEPDGCGSELRLTARRQKAITNLTLWSVCVFICQFVISHYLAAEQNVSFIAVPD